MIRRLKNQQISEIVKITKNQILLKKFHRVTSNRDSEIYEKSFQIEVRNIFKYESCSRNSILMIPILNYQQISEMFKITKNQIHQNFIHGVTSNRNSQIHKKSFQTELRNIFKYESRFRNSVLMIPKLKKEQISEILNIMKNQIYQNFIHGVT